MTELDFDELDKAVNNLMTDVDTSKRNPGLDDPEDKVVTLEMSDNPDATLESISASVAEESAIIGARVVAATPVAPLAVKRRGQFMDMIHPSSDMKATAPGPISRQGVTLQPSSPSITPEAPAATNTPAPDVAVMPSLGMEMESTGTGTPPVAQEQAQPITLPDEPIKNEWPDPIDMAQQDDASIRDDSAVHSEEYEAPKSDPEPQFEEAMLQNDEPSTDADSSSDEGYLGVAPSQPESLSSPFITDAKVDKRPLGMPVADEPQPEPVEPEPQVAPETPVGDVPPVILPDELRSDVMSLESSNTGAAVSPEPIAEPSPSPEVAPTADTGAGSIQQQYTEQPNTGDQTNTPIFDTSTHEQPLEAPKKKSPLKWILMTIVLLVLGAAAGAAYFYYTTQ